MHRNKPNITYLLQCSYKEPPHHHAQPTILIQCSHISHAGILSESPRHYMAVKHLYSHGDLGHRNK